MRLISALIVSVLLFAPTSSALKRRLKKENSSRVTVVTLKSAPAVKYGCYAESGAKGLFGRVRNGVFRHPASPPRLSRTSSKKRKAQRKEFKTVQQWCRKGYLTGNTAPGGGSTGTVPGKNPSPPPSGGSGGGGAPYNSPPIPFIDLWRSQMVSYGETHCRNLQSSSLNFDSKLLATYYDAQWVFYQIGDYTGDSKWYQCAQAAERIYRDAYLIANNGVVPGYWSFGHGLLRDYLSTGDSASRTGVLMLSNNASYAPDTTPLAWTADASMSREVAYAIMAYLNAEHVGQQRKGRLGLLVSQALAHLDQWFVSQSAEYVRPFMFALTSQALIAFDTEVGSPRILPAIKHGADWIWNNTWIDSQAAFKYTDRNHSSGGTEAAPDLNLLIAPVYAWLWHRTGETVYRDRADKIFVGGVRNAYLVNGKQYNQNYRWSFDYIRWRSSAPIK